MTRRRRTTIGGQFAPRLIEMLESPAYRALSLSAHRVLARLETELAHHGGLENGLRGLSAALREAVAESKLAYELNTNTYSYSCLSACLAVERAFEVLRDALEAETKRKCR